MNLRVEPRCGDCIHFSNDPAFLEAEIKGLISMGSAHASVSRDDGLCSRHGRHTGAHSRCDDFTVSGTD